MATYTRQQEAVFLHPFTPGDAGAPYPAGRFDVEVDEETINDPSFPIRRRTAAIVYVQDPSSGAPRALRVDPEALEAVLRANAARLAGDGLGATRSGTNIQAYNGTTGRGFVLLRSVGILQRGPSAFPCHGSVL